MNYLYKLLGKTTKKELVEHNRLSLSRPLFEFESEGKGISIFREIKDMVEGINDPNEIKPTRKILIEIKSLIESYYYSLPEDIRKNYSDYDIGSDLLIVMTIYCQTYCGYFTKTNLYEKEIRDNFLSQNSQLACNKIAYARIPIESNMLNQLYWISKNDDYTFCYTQDQSDNMFVDGIKASLRIHNIEYAPLDKLSNAFKTFNGKDERRISSLFRYLIEENRNQEEVRLLVRLPSYRKNENVIGFSNLYDFKQYNTLKEYVFYILASIYLKTKDYPQFVYLQIKEYQCFDLN